MTSMSHTPCPHRQSPSSRGLLESNPRMWANWFSNMAWILGFCDSIWPCSCWPCIQLLLERSSLVGLLARKLIELVFHQALLVAKLFHLAFQHLKAVRDVILDHVDVLFLWASMSNPSYNQWPFQESKLNWRYLPFFQA